MWGLGRGKQLNLVRQHVSGKRAQHLCGSGPCSVAHKSMPYAVFINFNLFS
jgi:hypothetical protein